MAASQLRHEWHPAQAPLLLVSEQASTSQRARGGLVHPFGARSPSQPSQAIPQLSSQRSRGGLVHPLGGRDGAAPTAGAAFDAAALSIERRRVPAYRAAEEAQLAAEADAEAKAKAEEALAKVQG